MENPLVITYFIILLPLIPAGCIYWLLTPKRQRGSAGNNAVGNAKTSIGPTVLGIKFNVVGSTAFYIVVLPIAFGIFNSVSQRALEGQLVRQQALKDDAAWLVELPVGAETISSQEPQKWTPGALDPATQSQLQVEMQPSFEMYGDTIQFWVTPHNKRFPKVTISLPKIGSAPAVDLNDPQRVNYDYTNHQMTGIGKQWIKIQRSYDPGSANIPQVIR